jgi:hypothetical protein
MKKRIPRLKYGIEFHSYMSSIGEGGAAHGEKSTGRPYL